MKIFRKYFVIVAIILLTAVSVAPGISNIKSETIQSNGKTMVKIADISTKWDEFGLCTDVNVTCYDHDVTWSAERFGTVKGILMYVNWSWEILKTPMFLPRIAFYYMHIIDVDRDAWIPFVLPQFYIKPLWTYGEGNFTGKIFISFNTKNRDYIPLDIFVQVQGYLKADSNSTIIDSGTSLINVTIA